MGAWLARGDAEALFDCGGVHRFRRFVRLPRLGGGCRADPACASPPCLDPLLLLDAAETEKYVDAFPFADYEQHVVPRPPWSCSLHGWVQCLSIWWRTPYIGRLWIEPPPRDPIKANLAKGLVWEPHVVRNLQEHVVPGSVVLDVGAYIGTHALLMGRLVGPQGRVYAFEPQRKAYRELRRNIELNGLSNVMALRYAVGADTGIVEMNPPREIAVVDVKEGLVGKAMGEGGVAVGAGGDRTELRPLDSFGFQNVSVLKIDVEGFEGEVLAGAERLIRENRPVISARNSWRQVLSGRTDPGPSSGGDARRLGAHSRHLAEDRGVRLRSASSVGLRLHRPATPRRVTRTGSATRLSRASVDKSPAVRYGRTA